MKPTLTNLISMYMYIKYVNHQAYIQYIPKEWKPFIDAMNRSWLMVLTVESKSQIKAGQFMVQRQHSLFAG